MRPLIRFAGVLLLAAAARAEIEVKSGPLKADVGGIAQVDVPFRYGFVDKSGMKEFMARTNNLYSGTEMGVILNDAETDGFWVFFEFDDIGYIKDAADEKLEPKKMWDNMTENQGAANDARKKQGWSPMEMVKWEKEPQYNPLTQRLEWAMVLRSEGKEFINFNTRILGRRGVMRITLVPHGHDLRAVLPAFNGLMQSFQFKAGHKYAEWVRGDKVAEYGLAALVVGGAAAVALKSGLLQKFAKLIVIGFLAALRFLKNLWNKITGGGSSPKEPPSPGGGSPSGPYTPPPGGAWGGSG